MDNLISIPICNCCSKCEINKEVLKNQTNQCILHFLMKIDERFEHVRSNILMMPKLLGVSQGYRILQQEETHKQISKKHHIKPASFFSSKRQLKKKSQLLQILYQRHILNNIDIRRMATKGLFSMIIAKFPGIL